ncbi:MAG TPA: hypothetical protein VFV67_34170 [Actinophytocola sp.]|uniref:DUF7426 family protein n=1 Tax=Actinophytocola sp. TaxID=1872138 RepID=UPI002DB7148F|nr:hypothetical protein [Actinophytocola sp.]HEU5475715.1 hypothetical protein [Actinophytocola sp.]
MTTFPDLADIGHFLQEADGETLTLPVRGKNYTWRAGAITIRANLRLQQARAGIETIQRKLAAGEKVDPTVELLPGVDEDEFAADLIGQAVIDQMAADGVMLDELQHIGLTLMTWHLSGEAAARAMWLGQVAAEGDADPPARGSGSTRTAGSSTRKPARAGSAGQRSSRAGRSSKPVSKRTTGST